MRKNQKGFTLVEIMIVVAIIALIAAIAIPNLLRAKIAANDSGAKSTLKTLSTAAETYAGDNNGQYPLNQGVLTGPVPPYLNAGICGTAKSGYNFTCAFAVGAYTFTATPINIGTTGTRVETIVTGGVPSW